MRGGIALDNPNVKSRLAQWTVKARGLKLTTLRSISPLSKDQTPGVDKRLIEEANNGLGAMVAIRSDISSE